MVLFVGTLLGLLASQAVATTTPGVSATPYNNGSHPWKTDGCTLVPDSGLYTKTVWVSYGWGLGASIPVTASWDFNHACIHHDGCYSGHWASKGTCDSWFLNDMRASCSAMHGRGTPKDTVCREKAWTYYVGVVAFGGPAYSGWSYLIRFA